LWLARSLKGPDVTKHPKRRRKTPQRQRIFTLNAPPSLSDDQVLTFAEWCALNGISPRTGRRILCGPDGPAIVWLSPRRFGIRVGANRQWQQAREKEAHIKRARRAKQGDALPR